MSVQTVSLTPCSVTSYPAERKPANQFNYVTPKKAAKKPSGFVSPPTVSAHVESLDHKAANKKSDAIREPPYGTACGFEHDNVDLNAASVPPTPFVPANKAVSEALVLTQEEQDKVSKYSKMIKVGIPKHAVHHKMKNEEVKVSDKIVEAVLGKEWLDDQIAPQTASKPQKNTNTKKLHLRELSPEKAEQSIFAKARGQNIIEQECLQKLDELFQKGHNSASAKKQASGADNAGERVAKILNWSRAHNIEIHLKKFSDFTNRSLAETINYLDPHRTIVGERAQFLHYLLPTPKEIAAIKKFEGDDGKLNKGASCWLYSLFCHSLH